MAFVPINEVKKISCEDRRLVSPTLTIYGHGSACITRAVYDEIKPSTIEVEVDFEMGKVRLKTGLNLSKKLYGRVGHTFSVPVAVRRKVLPDAKAKLTIPLTRYDDGWWYGTFKGDE